MNVGRNLYVECCQRAGVKPNDDIQAQIDAVDILHVRLLDASHTFLGRLGCLAVLYFTRQHQSVEEVRLPRNCVDDACMQLLADIISDGHPNLRSVDVSGNPLSTPALRQVWAAARTNSHFIHLNLDGCGVPAEWVTRMASTLRANAEMERLGFVPHGVPRNPQSWHTVFLLALGTPEAIQEYCDECLPMVNNFVAAMRVRVAALSLSDTDTADQVEAKLARCQDPFNHQLTWCVAILGPDSLPKRQQYALKKVLLQKPPPRLPLRTKLGELRAPTYRAARSCFCYTPVSWEMSGDACDLVPAAQWLRNAGYAGSGACESLVATVDTPAVILTPGNRVARWQSDLFASLSGVFRESDAEGGAPSVSLEVDMLLEQEGPRLFYTSPDEVQLMRHFVRGGRYHPKKSALVLKYACGPYRDSDSPFILYGATSIGKGYILCNVANMLMEGHVCEGGERPARVVCYTVVISQNSVVVFFYRLLHLFQPESTCEFTSVRALAEAVRSAIHNYSGPTLALLLGRVDLLDTCGCDCSVIAAWMPNVLPRAVRIVVSLNTDSPVLPLLRRRTPQPFECLCPPMTELHCVEVFSAFLKYENIALPGMEKKELKSRDGLGTAEKTYLQKEEAMTALYPCLAAAYVHCLLMTGHRVESEFEANQLIETALPPTVRELVQSLHDKAAELHSVLTVEVLLIVIALAPLPASELVYVCEELGPCPRQTALSTLLLLLDMKLIMWYEDATVHVSHPALKDIILDLYSARVPELSVLLESHLYRLVITYSSEVPCAIWYLMPLMISNGSMTQAAQLLRNPVLMDATLRRGPLFRFYVLDAFLRLLQARKLLGEVAALGGPPVPTMMAEGPLITCLREVAAYTSDLYQTALLRRTFSPYAIPAAAAYCATPQLLLRPSNNGQESTAARTAHTSDPCSWCHCRHGYVATATNDSVLIFTTNLGKPVAELHLPFERQQRIRGVLLAAGTRVLVASETQVLVWDYEGNSNFLFAELQMDVRPSALDAFGTVLIASSTSTGQLYLIDVLKKRIVRDLPDMEEGVRQKGVFSGNHLLLTSRCSLFRFDEEMKSYVTLVHDDLVQAVSANRDGRILVSAAGDYVHVWTAAGNLLHRLDVGADPIVQLQMSHSGANFVIQQGATLQLWKTLNGAPCATLANPFRCDAEVEYFAFTDDSTQVVARAGPYIMLWDAHKGHLVGAESIPTGLIAHIAVCNHEVYATTTSNDVHVWSLERGLSSVEQIKEDNVTTNFLRNGKVSRQAVMHVSVNRAGTILVVADAARQVNVFSLATGLRIEHCIRNVKDAVAVATNEVAYLPLDAHTLCFQGLTGETEVHTLALPKDSLPQAHYDLCVSPDEHFLAVTHYYHHHSRAFLYAIEENTHAAWCQLQGHTGRMLSLSFFGSFAFSAGEDDSCVRLWSLARKAERTSYTHHCPLVAATGNGAGLFYCIDAKGSVLRLHVDNIVSAKHATLLVTNLVLRAAQPQILASPISRLSTYDGYLILVRQSGDLLIVDTQREDVAHRVAFRDCQCATVASVLNAPVLFTGHRSGVVYLNNILRTEKSTKICT